MANIWQERKRVKPEGLKVTFDVGSTIKNVEIISMVDDVVKKTVVVVLAGGSFYTLWSGDAYDAIANWTNELAIERLKEIILEDK
jgi:hypothetical protein